MTKGSTIAQLKLRLAEATETLDAIRGGAVDALVVHGPKGPRVFTLKGADHPYRLVVEAMNEGAVTVDARGRILYSNARFAEILCTPLENVLGALFADFVNVGSKLAFSHYFKKATKNQANAEITLNASKGQQLAVLLSSNPLQTDVKGVCMVVTDITARKLAEEARAELAKQVLVAQELERQRVARELHDSVNQLLSTTRHRALGLATQLKTAGPDAHARLAEVIQLLERTMREVRLISRNLRPSELDDLGLIPALSSLVEETAERTGMDVQLSTPKNLSGLSPQLELTIYRIAQEALSNVEKHSGATSTKIVVERQGKFLIMTIQDDGKGFAAKKSGRSGWGLLNMRERASYVGGSLEIEPRSGKGTAIIFRVLF
ncbi:MAG TPA: histidine kinase [Candidatus Binatia bacterium]|nr:histidine kinase [Candidatus Binatia bacterium]